MRFPRFVGSVPLGSVMPSSLHFLVGVLGRPEELAEEAEGPRQFPGHSRGPPGGGGSFAVRLQHLLSPLFQDFQAHRSVHLRASSLLHCEILRSALTHLYRGSGWRGIGQKVDWGGGDSRARASVFCAATSSSRRLPNSSGTFGPEDVRWPGGDHLLLRANSKAPRFVTESGGSVAAATACARSGATCLPIR